MKMVSIDNISKTYILGDQPIHAIDHISLQVDGSEFLLITGPSGAGKTTLLNLIGGMTRCGSGRIVVDGKNISTMSNVNLARFRRDSIGFIFQFQSMISTLNVFENILLPSRFSGRKPNISKVHDVLCSIGLRGKERAYKHHLSIGEQRRVAVVREMVRESRLLLCDEPTGDLDPDTEDLVLHMIAGRQEQQWQLLNWKKRKSCFFMTSLLPWLFQHNQNSTLRCRWSPKRERFRDDRPWWASYKVQ